MIGKRRTTGTAKKTTIGFLPLPTFTQYMGVKYGIKKPETKTKTKEKPGVVKTPNELKLEKTIKEINEKLGVLKVQIGKQKTEIAGLRRKLKKYRDDPGIKDLLEKRKEAEFYKENPDCLEID